MLAMLDNVFNIGCIEEGFKALDMWIEVRRVLRNIAKGSGGIRIAFEQISVGHGVDFVSVFIHCNQGREVRDGADCLFCKLEGNVVDRVDSPVRIGIFDGAHDNYGRVFVRGDALGNFHFVVHVQLGNGEYKCEFAIFSQVVIVLDDVVTKDVRREERGSVGMGTLEVVDTCGEVIQLTLHKNRMVS